MFSKRKAWDLQDAVVTVDIERTDEVEKFKRTIELFCNLDTEQRER
jgi:putative redox protein